jgi:glycosyltransferase involved in cell wall biosynthesis
MIVTHILPHLGGGIGKALSGLVEQSTKVNSEFTHDIICLEEPIKRECVDKIIKCGRAVTICPAYDEFEKLIDNSDIIQLEWINNHTIIKYLKEIKSKIRLIVWCHNNGLYPYNIKDPGKLPPIIPKKLILSSDRFIFTTECSFDIEMVKNILKNHYEYYDKLWAIYSSGGFDGFPNPESKDSFSNFSNDNMSIGYFGTINFAKLHPQFVDFIKAINIPGFKVKMIGEYSEEIKNQMNRQCEIIGKPGILEFTGYVPEHMLVSELGSINVIAYILNPGHYGTTENSLLEAMSMGIVPIILDNPAEMCIVKQGKNGLIVKNEKEFAEAIQYLYKDPDYRQKLGINAAKYVRKNFSTEKVNDDFNFHYDNMMNIEKRKINFNDIF